MSFTKSEPVNNDVLDYKSLSDKYKELQLRVTRFSATQQQLINANDKLDRELLSYNRMINYNVNCSNNINNIDFLRLTAEAIIDIFETDISIVVIEDHSRGGDNFFYISGAHLSDADKTNVLSDIHLLLKGRELASTVLLSSFPADKLAYFQSYKDGLFYTFPDLRDYYSIHIIALYTERNHPGYVIDKRSETMFSVFGQQVESIYIRRIQNKKIEKQLIDIKKAEDELKMLSLIATKTKNGVIIADSSGNIEWVNKAFTDTTLFSMGEVLGKKPGHFLQGPATDADTRHMVNDHIKKLKNVETVIVNYKKNGELFYNLLEINPVFDEKGKLKNYIALQKDITSDYLYRAEILRINSIYELIASKSNIGVWEWDLKSKKLSWNDILVNQYGAKKDDAESDYFRVWKSCVLQKSVKTVLDTFRKVISGNTEYAECEYLVSRLDDGRIRAMRGVTIAERDVNGKLMRIIGTSIDITNTKEHEQELLAKNEELSKINGELDNFVYSVSHDLRSPLLAVKGILALIDDGDTDIDDVAEYLSLIGQSVSRMDETIQEILNYSRNARLRINNEEFDVVEMLKACYEDLKFSIQDSIQLRITVEGDNTIISDKARVHTIIRNIVGNSFKYKKEGANDSYIDFHLINKDNEVKMTISDNGIGMSEATQKKAFNMFYRGTSQSDGTGLGLYICREIVNKLNGEINIDTEFRQGTTVNITIPQ